MYINTLHHHNALLWETSIIAFVILLCFYKYGNGDFGEIEKLCIRLHDALCQDCFQHNSPTLFKSLLKLKCWCTHVLFTRSTENWLIIRLIVETTFLIWQHKTFYIHTQKTYIKRQICTKKDLKTIIFLQIKKT